MEELVSSEDLCATKNLNDILVLSYKQKVCVNVCLVEDELVILAHAASIRCVSASWSLLSSIYKSQCLTCTTGQMTQKLSIHSAFCFFIFISFSVTDARASLYRSNKHLSFSPRRFLSAAIALYLIRIVTEGRRHEESPWHVGQGEGIVGASQVYRHHVLPLTS